MISPCSLSSNVSLTKRLIEVGQCSSSDVHRFSNRSEWIDGLDQWSIGETLPSLSPSLQFDQDLRLYFPAEKSKEVSSKVSSKWNSLPSNESLPLRLQVLLDKAKDLSSARDQPLEDTFLPFDSFNSSSFEQSEEKRPKKKEKKHSVRCPRHPLRSIGTDCSSSSTSGKECLTHRHEEENLDKILKEHLTSLFTRGSISQRTSIQIPLINIKHDNHFTRSIPSLDSTIILQRYEKLQQLLIQPMKTIQRRQEQAEEETRTTFALTITPLGLTDNQPSKKNPLFDRLNQQTDSLEQEEEVGSLVTKENLQESFLSSSGDLLVSNGSPLCPSRRLFRSHRFSSRTEPRRRKTSQYLPPILNGKRLQIEFNEQRR